MNSSDALDKILLSFKQYFDVSKENIEKPFSAEAVFVSHIEQYFIVHSAKLSDIDSTEHVYFSTQDYLTFEDLQNQCKTAWERGLKNVVPYYGHRNSDITVIAVCDKVEENLLKKCRKVKFSKTYKFMLFGWSNFKLCVIDLNTGKIGFNHFGSDYKKLLNKKVKKICNQ